MEVEQKIEHPRPGDMVLERWGTSRSHGGWAIRYFWIGLAR